MNQFKPVRNRNRKMPCKCRIMSTNARWMLSVDDLPLFQNVSASLFPQKFSRSLSSNESGRSRSIFFRNEELMLSYSDNAVFLYDNVIMPHKGELEVWFVENNSLKIYFALIIATVIVVLFDKIPFQKSIFKEIPKSSDIQLY